MIYKSEISSGPVVMCICTTIIWNRRSYNLSREPRSLPKLVIRRKRIRFLIYRFEDFEVVDYDPYPGIKLGRYLIKRAAKCGVLTVTNRSVDGPQRLLDDRTLLAGLWRQFRVIFSLYGSMYRLSRVIMRNKRFLYVR